MSAENYLLSETLSIRNGFMYCENVCIKTLQEQLENELKTASSPVFVYSQAQVLLNTGRYRQALESKSGLQYLLGYALKANYNPHIVRLVRDSGCCVIAVSGHEVRLALQENISPDRIILNGNGKLEWELELAVSSGCLVNVDSSFDLSCLKVITERLSKYVNVLIRLNPDIDPDVHPFLATGLSRSKFGVEDSQLAEILETIHGLPWIKLIGLHCHLGSTIGTTQVFRECLDVMLAAVENVRKRGFTDVKYINLGGGLNIDYRKHEHRTKPPKIEDGCDVTSGRDRYVPVPTAADLIQSIDTQRISDSGLTLILEPGRSIVGSAGLLVTKVIGCKTAGSKRYITVDGSMTEIIRPAFYGAYHHMELTEPSSIGNNDDVDQKVSSVETTKDTLEVFDVVGPVCECADFLGKDRLLPRPHSGCGLAVFDAGAYCASMGSNYNMRPRAAEVLVDGDEWRLIRRPETFEELLRAFPS